jgi:hypothetical protein
MAGKDDPVRRGWSATCVCVCCGGWRTGSAASPPLTPSVLLLSPPVQSAWADIRIPSVLVSASQGQRLIRLMRTEEVEVEGHGVQRYTP